MDRRHFMISCAGIASGLVLPAGAAAMFHSRKPISEHPFYRYLRNHTLRATEQGVTPLTIEDADFNTTAFQSGGAWEYFTFRNCHFATHYGINLDAISNCSFYNCEFGPGARDASLGFGNAKDVRMFNCKFTNGNVSFGRGNVHIQESEFTGEPAGPTSWNYFLAGGDFDIAKCTFRYVGIRVGSKLRMRSCDYRSAGASPIGSPNRDYSVEMVFENTKLANAEEFMWNNKIKSLTLRGVEVEGSFTTQRGEVRDSIILEGLNKGTYWVAQTGTEKQIVVRDCNFSEVNEKTTHLFTCAGTYVADFLMERVECTKAGGCDLTGAGPALKTKESFRLVLPRNQTFTLRDCKIPILYINWLQTFNLVIENCEIGKLDMKEGRIGNLTIRNTKFETLDLSNTQATKFDIDAASQKSGQIVTAGSNFPAGGYKIK